MIATKFNPLGLSNKPYDAEVESLYIANAGYFVVPIKHSSNVEVKMRCYPKGQLSSIVGKVGSGGVSIYAARLTTATFNNVQTASNFEFNNDLDLYLRNGLFIVNGEEYPFTPQSFTNDDFIHLGQTQNSTTINVHTYYYPTIEINDGVTFVEIIPVRIGNDGWLYDKVSKQLLERSTVGTFTVGADL